MLDRFHPSVASWFRERLGAPTAPQREGWPRIAAGDNVLIAAPTGSGKTLAGFLGAIDSLLRQGASLPDETQVVYVSPLRALSNDVEKNLRGPLTELAARDPSLPRVRVQVRTGDTPGRERAAMAKTPPHILVTTPESLYLLLTSASGRSLLSTTRTVIVDEIHALARDKRGSHLALSLERLETLVGRPVQRVGLSATQKPLADVGRFLVGSHRECTLVDEGAFRRLDLGISVPPSPLQTVCSHEQWAEIYAQIAELVLAHRTTLVFVNTRKMAERISAQLARLVGEDAVTSHHGSLSRERRLAAEQRLKSGSLRALVATASLELGIDIGDVDLVVQVGSTRSVATLLQRVGRAGHGLDRVPKGRVFPLTLDELVEAAALLQSVRRAELDQTPQPPRPLDILAQQLVAECVAGPRAEDELFAEVRRAWPYRELGRQEFDDVVRLHADNGRRALLVRDRVRGLLRATARAKLVALLSGGAIGDVADYVVKLEPEGTTVGTVNEDWAIESNAGDIFQLGNTSWRILRVEPGVVRVADAKGQPPTLPFWLGEAPARTRELSAAIAELREACAAAGVEPAITELQARCGDGLDRAGALQIAEYVLAGRTVLGAVPTQRRVVLERFFDESGGSQLVVHAPFGARINRAWGLALRKRFCVGFGFELQAAANEEAIILSLGLQHSFPLGDVFDYLHVETARDVLVQALLASPMFTTRWRWNAQRSLLLERHRGGKKIPANLARMKADDLLAAAFPAALACPETLPGGPIEVPDDHPIVRQTVEDCLTEAMDVDGFLAVIAGLADGSIERCAIDTAEPSAFARGILTSAPYTFLDDAPLEERRTQAVMMRRVLDVRSADALGALDDAAVARVRAEAWPQPDDADELFEALSWMGFVTVDESAAWAAWMDELVNDGRAVREGDRYYAAFAPRDPKLVMRARLEALGPIVVAEDSEEHGILVALESEGGVMRTRLGGVTAWCDRRLLARIQRYTLDRLRREIEPVTAGQFLRFLARWQRVARGYELQGPQSVLHVAEQLAGFEIPLAAWESHVLPARIEGYQPQWLDDATLSGKLAWGRLWGAALAPVARTPIALVAREDLEVWTELARSTVRPALGPLAVRVLEMLVNRGALFSQEIARISGLTAVDVDEGLGELVASGRVTCDSFAGLRALLAPTWHRRGAVSSGRWSVLGPSPGGPPRDPEVLAEFVARALLRRTGVLFRRTAARERIGVTWREVARACRRLEARGEIRGGRFVAGFDGEQYALPEAISLLRSMRRAGVSHDERTPSVCAADPLNFTGILTPEERVPAHPYLDVRVG